MNEEERADFFMQYFNDYDADEKFEGFNEFDIAENIEIVGGIDIEQAENDRDIRDDVEVGWSREDVVPLIAPFTGKPGLQRQLPENPEPFDFFNLLFKENMWELLVNEMNRYAEGRTNGVHIKPFSRIFLYLSYDTHT